MTKSIELNPQYASAYNNRGNAKRNLDNYKGTIADYDKAIELNPQDADAYHMSGLSKALLGQYEEAAKDLFIALELYQKEGDQEGIQQVREVIKLLLNGF